MTHNVAHFQTDVRLSGRRERRRAPTRGEFTHEATSAEGEIDNGVGAEQPRSGRTYTFSVARSSFSTRHCGQLYLF